MIIIYGNYINLNKPIESNEKKNAFSNMNMKRKITFAANANDSLGPLLVYIGCNQPSTSNSVMVHIPSRLTFSVVLAGTAFENSLTW